jgi:hypothetical protein
MQVDDIRPLEQREAIAMRVLISGAGIAGSTLAYWLDAAGREQASVSMSAFQWSAGDREVEIARVRVGAEFKNGEFVGCPTNQEVTAQAA